MRPQREDAAPAGPAGVKRVAITGCSGYLAGCLLPLLADDPEIQEIVGLDLVEPRQECRKMTFHRQDILDTESLTRVFRDVDCVVHMAFNIDGMHDQERLERLNVGGSLSVMRASADAQVRKLVFASSVAAYGAHPDNPVPLRETDPLRGKGTFFYADQKHRLEEELDRFEQEHPGIAVVRVRLSTTTGPKASNLTVGLLTSPVFVAFPFHRPKVQLLHEDDAARGFHLAIVRDVRGPLNFGSEWKHTARDHARFVGSKVTIVLPVWLCRSLGHVLWKLRVLRFDPTWISAAMYPVVVDTGRAERLLGWKPRHESPEILRSMGKMARR